MPGKGGKPSLMVDKHFNIWLGNETNEEVTFEGIELFGFGTGAFEQKIVRGGVRDTGGIAWRVTKDTELVAANKELMSVADFMHQMATNRGLATIEIEDHILEPKLHSQDQILCFENLFYFLLSFF